MIHTLKNVKELSALFNELAYANIGFYAFIKKPKIGDEFALIRRFMPYCKRIVINVDMYPDYFYDLGDMVFDDEEGMKKSGIDYVLKITFCYDKIRTIYVGYNGNGLPIYYDCDLKQVQDTDLMDKDTDTLI